MKIGCRVYDCKFIHSMMLMSFYHTWAILASGDIIQRSKLNKYTYVHDRGVIESKDILNRHFTTIE